MKMGGAILLALILAASGAGGGHLPQEVRGYKVERAKVRAGRRKNSAGLDGAQDLVTFGTARVTSIGPLEVALEVPVTIAPVEASGEVELLVFEGGKFRGFPVPSGNQKSQSSLPQGAPLPRAEPLRL